MGTAGQSRRRGANSGGEAVISKGPLSYDVDLHHELGESSMLLPSRQLAQLHFNDVTMAGTLSDDEV
jgi:hypothetical protein